MSRVPECIWMRQQFVRRHNFAGANMEISRGQSSRDGFRWWFTLLLVTKMKLRQLSGVRPQELFMRSLIKEESKIEHTNVLQTVGSLLRWYEWWCYMEHITLISIVFPAITWMMWSMYGNSMGLRANALRPHLSISFKICENPSKHVLYAVLNLHDETHCLAWFKLTISQWGRMTHTCVGKLVNIASYNGLSPGCRQAIFCSEQVLEYCYLYLWE